jgi:hypothetical protein
MKLGWDNKKLIKKFHGENRLGSNKKVTLLAASYTGQNCGAVCYAPNAMNIQQPVYSPHLMIRQIYGKATSDRPSCDVCTALPFVSM